MKIESVGIVLQKIYDSEIHLSLGWMWDGGIEYGIGFDISYLEGTPEATGEQRIEAAIEILADDVARKYPESSFAAWWELNKNIM